MKNEEENTRERIEVCQIKRWFTTRTLTGIAILAAISSILYYFPELPVPFMPFWMKLDFSNVPALIGAFALGPLGGGLIILVKDLIGLTHSTSGGVGELADFLVSITYIIPAALIYWKYKNRKGALLGMTIGIIGIIVMGCVTNYYLIIPVFSKLFIPLDQILAIAAEALPGVTSLWTYVLWVVIPFNFIKGLVVSAITFILYKRLSPILHSKRV